MIGFQAQREIAAAAPGDRPHIRIDDLASRDADFGERGAAVGRAVQARIRRGEDNRGVSGSDLDIGNLRRVAKDHRCRPGVGAIGGLGNADAGAIEGIAKAQVERSGRVRIHLERPNRQAAERFGLGRPGRAAIGRLPHTAAGKTDVDCVRADRIGHDRVDAAGVGHVQGAAVFLVVRLGRTDIGPARAGRRGGCLRINHRLRSAAVWQRGGIALTLACRRVAHEALVLWGPQRLAVTVSKRAVAVIVFGVGFVVPLVHRLLTQRGVVAFLFRVGVVGAGGKTDQGKGQCCVQQTAAYACTCHVGTCSFKDS